MCAGYTGRASGSQAPTLTGRRHTQGKCQHQTLLRHYNPTFTIPPYHTPLPGGGGSPLGGPACTPSVLYPCSLTRRRPDPSPASSMYSNTPEGSRQGPGRSPSFIRPVYRAGKYRLLENATNKMLNTCKHQRDLRVTRLSFRKSN